MCMPYQNSFGSPFTWAIPGLHTNSFYLLARPIPVGPVDHQFSNFLLARHQNLLARENIKKNIRNPIHNLLSDYLALFLPSFHSLHDVLLFPLYTIITETSKWVTHVCICHTYNDTPTPTHPQTHLPKQKTCKIKTKWRDALQKKTGQPKYFLNWSSKGNMLLWFIGILTKSQTKQSGTVSFAGHQMSLTWKTNPLPP